MIKIIVIIFPRLIETIKFQSKVIIEIAKYELRS